MNERHSSASSDKKGDESRSFQLNRRNHNRYSVREFSAGESGAVTDISAGGMRIRKASSEEISAPQLTFTVSRQEVTADLVWQNEQYAGLRFVGPFDVVPLIRALTKRIQELEINPKNILQDITMTSSPQKDVFGICINLMAELENVETDIKQVKICVQKISDIYKEPHDSVGPDSPGEIGEAAHPAQNEPTGLAKVLIDAANTARAGTESIISDLDFAIARLGRDSVKKLSVDFLRKEIASADISLSGFDTFHADTILKTILFKHLSHFLNIRMNREKEGCCCHSRQRGLIFSWGRTAQPRKT